MVMAHDGSAKRAEAPLSPRKDFLLAERPGYLLHKAALLLGEDVEKALGDIGIRTRYFFVLAALEGGTTLSQQDLSRLLNLDPTTVVVVIDEMEGNGHAERRRNPTDRRRYSLTLTDAGRTLLAKANNLVTDVEAEFFGTLDEGEKQALREMLGRTLTGRWPASVCAG